MPSPAESCYQAAADAAKQLGRRRLERGVVGGLAVGGWRRRRNYREQWELWKRLERKRRLDKLRVERGRLEGAREVRFSR